ncbi:hypothetical protein PoB_002008100 [Plakobranchus ocellatus]|uniref:Uncharacterized protein n=1 Tax=Plakobranchus ocellatus TaxID=259542 RepID=A0AAV3Z2N6_9GAST|nr:hypothetical protein PoB_002008100 [Plakobranchus ocellatus]
MSSAFWTADQSPGPYSHLAGGQTPYSISARCPNYNKLVINIERCILKQRHSILCRYIGRDWTETQCGTSWRCSNPSDIFMILLS